MAAGVVAWPPVAAPEPEAGSFAFAALGDAPYYPWEEIQYRRVFRQLNRSPLVWVLHVGDIFWRPCTDRLMRERYAAFERCRHPVIYTPGDNEWADCHEPGSGAFQPLERLAALREIFFSHPHRSLGRSTVTLASQADEDPDAADLVENVRWQYQGVVFVTVHLVGSRNGGLPFPGRTERDDQDSRHRLAAATRWLRRAFSVAHETEARAVVLATHADLAFESPAGDDDRLAFDPFVLALEEETERFARPVLLVHGDSHELLVDHPLVRRTSGATLANLTRLEVPGSPAVGWVRVEVSPERVQPFSFTPYLRPRWQIW